MEDRLLRERGLVLGFRVLDDRRLLETVLNLRPGTHATMSGSWERPNPWPSALHSAEKPVLIDRLEARERANDSAAFVVDEITRHVLMHVLDPCIRNEPWHVWHWWLHDQATLLLSFYDWDCPDGMCCAHPSLEPWLLDLARARVIERAEDMEFTDEWFDWQNQQHVQLLEQAQER
jgi:hypothetical protein